MANSPNRTVRISDTEWATVQAEARRRGVRTTDLLLAGWLRPSLSVALETLNLAVGTEADRMATLELALRTPSLTLFTPADLHGLASGLNALAARWPR